MSALSVFAPYPLFSDTDGSPLESGYVYVGTANLNPETNPIAVYWDAAMTIPAAQPIRTSGGFPVRYGTPAPIYVNASDYSLTVKDKRGNLVLCASSLALRLNSGVIGSLDSSSVLYTPPGTGAVAGTVKDELDRATRINVKRFGASPSASATVNNAAFAAAIAYVADTKQTLYVPAGNWSLTNGFSTTGDLHIEGDGDSTVLDWSGGITGSSQGITVTGSLTQIENISSASKGNLTITFASAPSLAASDVFVLYDSANLWNAVRAYYYKGEWCECRGLSGTDAQLTNPLYDGYSAVTTKAYKLAGPSVSFRNFRVKGSTSLGLLKLSMCNRPLIENVSGYHEGYQIIEVDRCYKPTIINADLYNKGTGTLDDYGLVIGNSQHVRIIGGNFYSRRHGTTFGGGDYIGAVTNRDVRVIGATIKNDITSQVYAADMHGNIQDFCYQDCTIYQGGGWAGMDSGYDNCTIYGALGGWCIYAGEIKGGDLYARNCSFITGGDPSAISRGIVDVGGNSTAIGTFTDNTLNLIIENCFVRAPAATGSTSFMVVANGGGSLAYVNIKIDGLAGDVGAALDAILRTRVDVGAAYSQAIVVDRISNFPAGTYLHMPQGGAYLNKPQKLMRQSGSQSLTATSGTSFTNGVATNLRYLYPRPPAGCATASSPTGLLYNGNRVIYASLYKLSESVVQPFIESGDATNWSSTSTVNVGWTVGIDEV